MLDGISMPIFAIVFRKSSRFSALFIASIEAPISSTPLLLSTPLSLSLIAILSAVCPPIVGKITSGFSILMTDSRVFMVIGSI